MNSRIRITESERNTAHDTHADYNFILQYVHARAFVCVCLCVGCVRERERECVWVGGWVGCVCV